MRPWETGLNRKERKDHETKTVATSALIERAHSFRIKQFSWRSLRSLWFLQRICLCELYLQQVDLVVASDFIPPGSWLRWVLDTEVAGLGSGHLFKPHSPTPLPALGAGYGASHKICGGEGLSGRLSPRAGSHQLACPGLPSCALPGLKTRSPCEFPLPLVSRE